VLVIKGDHDSDFSGDYEPERINRLAGCREISGTTFEIRGLTFLGVSYQETAYRTSPRVILSRFPQRGGVVISHARQRNVRFLTQLAPKLIIRGHFGVGKYLIDGVPAVFTSGAYAIVDVPRTGLPRIRQPSMREAVFVKILKEAYPWLRPYSTSLQNRGR